MLATLDVKLVFPARAGMSPDTEVSTNKVVGVPRASGDEPRLYVRLNEGEKCSPRERG